MNQMDTEESTEDLQPDSQVEESDSVATEANESLDTSVEPEEGSEPNENSDNAELSDDESQSGDLDFDDITRTDDIDALVDAWEHRTEEDDEPEPEKKKNYKPKRTKRLLSMKKKPNRSLKRNRNLLPRS